VFCSWRSNRSRLSRRVNNKDNYIIEKGDRIAQLILEKASILPVEEGELDETDRGENGSTGK